MIHCGGGWQSGEDGKSVLLVHMYSTACCITKYSTRICTHLWWVSVVLVKLCLYVILLHIPFPGSLVCFPLLMPMVGDQLHHLPLTCRVASLPISLSPAEWPHSPSPSHLLSGLTPNLHIHTYTICTCVCAYP